MKKRFNVRIELLGGASGDDYLRLHARMIAKQFATIIVANDETVHHLPPAEYVYVSEGAATEVRDQADAIVASGLRDGLGHRSYIVEFVDWASTNLQPM